MNNGFIKLYRSLRDWEYYGQPSAVTLWIHLLITANWEDKSFRGESVPRGALITSIAHLSRDTGLSERTIRRWLDRFRASGMIEIKATNRWTSIKVLKYSTFQGIPEKQVTEQMTERVTEQMTDNLRNKEDKEIKNIPPISPKGGREYSRKRKDSVRIDTPDWYKRVKSEGLPEETQASDELIAEFEAWKEKVSSDND